MSLSDLLKKRVSARAYMGQPVSRDILEKIFTNAQLSPSNCNVQPWQVYVVSGAVKAVLNIPDHLGILFGMSFGYPDKKAPVNTTRTDRVPMENSVVFSD